MLNNARTDWETTLAFALLASLSALNTYVDHLGLAPVPVAWMHVLLPGAIIGLGAMVRNPRDRG